MLRLPENIDYGLYLGGSVVPARAAHSHFQQALFQSGRFAYPGVEAVENTNKQIEAEQKEQTLLESNLKRSDIYIHFHQAAKNQTNITAAEWNDLQAMIDQTYGMFTKRLYALFPQISEQELRICLLLKISISATGIANLTLRSKQAVTSSRKKLYEKTHGQQGGPEKWDQFIQAF